MDQGFSYEVTRTDSKTRARCGRISTPHGSIQTPAFVPVGTQGSVKSLDPLDLVDLDVHLFFVNTYHMVLRPGMERIKKFGGIHSFMHWDRPVITDSGGFQIFSLGSKRFGNTNSDDGGKPLLVSLDDTGVRFRSHWDGSEYEFTPERSMEYQWTIGSDIHIAFDDCTPYPVSPESASRSMERTHLWATKSLSAHQQCWKTAGNEGKPYQALYGSIQGSVYESLRKKSAMFVTGMPFDGFAIGGVSVGESKEDMKHVLDWVTPLLPDGKPRHLLGVGEIDDIFELIAHGVDTFDCVGPTRLARMGTAYVHPWGVHRYGNDAADRFQINITKSVYLDDDGPIDPLCGCATCKRFSRGYIAHLFRSRELLAYRLLTIHNIAFINNLVLSIRESIASSTFLELQDTWLYNK